MKLGMDEFEKGFLWWGLIYPAITVSVIVLAVWLIGNCGN